MKHHVSKSWLHSDSILPRLVSLSQTLLQKEQAVEAGVRAKRQVKQRMEEQLRTVEVRLSLLAQREPTIIAVTNVCPFHLLAETSQSGGWLCPSLHGTNAISSGSRSTAEIFPPVSGACRLYQNCQAASQLIFAPISSLQSTLYRALLFKQELIQLSTGKLEVDASSSPLRRRWQVR